MKSWNYSFKPRGWQEEAFKKWKKNFSGTISVVTGGGKTFFAFISIAEFVKKYPEGKIVVIVPTSALLDQWFVGFQTDLNVDKSEINCFSGKEKPKISNKINLIIINTARKKEIRDKFKNEDIFLIVDECHRSGSYENSKSLDFKTVATLGLSATPVREFDDGFEELISPKIGDIIYEYDYLEAYRDGILSDFELINLRTDFADDELIEYEKINKRIAITLSKIKKGEESLSKLNELLIARKRISNSSVMRIPPTMKLINDNSNKKMIIFCQTISQAEIIFDFMNEYNHNCTIYHSKVGKMKRRLNLIDFKRGIYNILITCIALDEGLNVPSIELGIIVSSTSTNRQRIQRLGRVLRKSDKKSKSQIFTIYITKEEEKFLVKESKKLDKVAKISWLKY